MIWAGFRSMRRGVLVPLAVLGLAAALGGCVAYPAYPGYYGGGYYGGGYYGSGYGYYDGGYYGGGYPASGFVEFGTTFRGGDRFRGERREHEEHRGFDRR